MKTNSGLRCSQTLIPNGLGNCQGSLLDTRGHSLSIPGSILGRSFRHQTNLPLLQGFPHTTGDRTQQTISIHICPERPCRYFMAHGVFGLQHLRKERPKAPSPTQIEDFRKLHEGCPWIAFVRRVLRTAWTRELPVTTLERSATLPNHSWIYSAVSMFHPESLIL